MIFINFKKNLNNNKKNVFKNILNTFFIMEVAQQQQSQAQQGQQQQIALSKIEIKDENIAYVPRLFLFRRRFNLIFIFLYSVTNKFYFFFSVRFWFPIFPEINHNHVIYG